MPGPGKARVAAVSRQRSRPVHIPAAASVPWKQGLALCNATNVELEVQQCIDLAFASFFLDNSAVGAQGRSSSSYPAGDLHASVRKNDRDTSCSKPGDPWICTIGGCWRYQHGSGHRNARTTGANRAHQFSACKRQRTEPNDQSGCRTRRRGSESRQLER